MSSLSVKMLTSVSKVGLDGMFGVGQSMGQAQDEVPILTQRATVLSQVRGFNFPLCFLSPHIYSRDVVRDVNCLYLNKFLSSAD